ncbi:ThiF family adenylyltransferase [Staphylococcus canis]|uniref:Molybdopterin biosynthesis protein MoeB n=1 Tax=Staphylococcus canis TaxID=2724942 RepID=A0ABS0T7A9_9STAP|nr:ThiF family adenylyltransferase [Staphylococcus canis]MBI5974626.1 molybdopterin biosynthesis protein MoeB [Staphylococcus canis]
MTQNRYSRQMLYRNIGEEGQAKISQKSALIVGMGALGTHVSEGLVRAGIGKIIIIDRDYIEHSNLQRQTLFTEKDADESIPKVIAAERALRDIRQDVTIEAFIDHVDAAFLAQYVPEVDVVIDATDNFETRMLINDAAYYYQKPWIYGGVVQSTYVEAAFIPGETPCFQCLVPQIPSMNLTCDTVGVIQPAVTMTTSLQIRDALKILTETAFTPKLTYGDIWEGTHYTFGFTKLYNPQCSTCGETPTYPYLNEQAPRFASMCGRESVQYQHPTLDQHQLLEYLQSRDIPYRSNDYLIQFKFDGYRFVGFQNGRILIHGLNDVKQAQTMIHKLFG